MFPQHVSSHERLTSVGESPPKPVSKQDCLVFTVAFLGTTFLGVDLGLAIAIGVSRTPPVTTHPSTQRTPADLLVVFV